MVGKDRVHPASYKNAALLRKVVHAPFHHRLGFHLNQVFVADEPRLDERVRRSDIPKPFAVDASHGFPVLYSIHIHSGSHDVLQPRTQRLQRALDLVDHEVGLCCRIRSSVHLLLERGSCFEHQRR